MAATSTLTPTLQNHLTFVLFVISFHLFFYNEVLIILGLEGLTLPSRVSPISKSISVNVVPFPYGDVTFFSVLWTSFHNRHRVRYRRCDRFHKDVGILEWY